MPTPGQRLTLGDAIGFTLENHPRRLAASSEAGRSRTAGGRGEGGDAAAGVMARPNTWARPRTVIGAANYLNPGFIPRHNGAAGQPQAWSLENNYLGGVGASQYLFDFGRVRGQIAEQRAQADAAGGPAQAHRSRPHLSNLPALLRAARGQAIGGRL